MAWTQPSDVRDRWIGELPQGVEDQYVATAIEDVEDQLIVMAPELVDQFGGPIPLARVKRVVANVIVRHLRNPEGVRVRSEATGPATASVTFSGDDPGALMVTADDIEFLRGRRGGDKAYGISMIPPGADKPWRLPPDPWTTY